MGGRGSSSGVSKYGNAYGSQYRTVLQSGNVKFVVAKTEGNPETLVETMTKGRVYALVNRDNGKLKSVMYFADDGKRRKRIDLDHIHKKTVPHVHDGYLGGEFRKDLSRDELAMVDKVTSLWEDHKRKL